MAIRPLTFRLALGALLAASLACNAVTNIGRSRVQGEVDSALATAAAVQTQAAIFDVSPTSTLDDQGGVDAPGSTPGGSGYDTGPADVPVYDNGTVEDFVGSTEAMSYFVEEEHKTVVEFYQEEMPENGWSAVPAVSLDMPDLAILTFERSGRTAIVTISIDPISSRLAVLVAVTQN